MKEKRIMIADDSCLFCGLHFGPAGGHLFIGECDKNGNLVSDDGAVCIEHQAHCAIQICPECVKKIRSVGLLE